MLEMTNPMLRHSAAHIDFYNQWRCGGSNEKSSYLVSELAQIQSEFVSRGGWKTMPKVVLVTIHVNAVSSIDQQRGFIEAQGSCHFRWFDAKHASATQGSKVDVDFSDGKSFIIWSPNASSLDFTTHPVSAQKFSHHNPGELYTHVSWKGIFRNSFDLRSFPFDVQMLEFSFVFSDGAMAGAPHHGYVFMPDYQYDEDLSVRCSHEWKYNVSKPTFSEWDAFEPRYYFNPEHAKPLTDPCKLRVDMRYVLKRRSFYHITSGFGFAFLTTSLAPVVFVISRDEGTLDTIGILVDLLLTLQALRFVVNSNVPDVPYLTTMDKYIWFCSFFVVVSIGVVVARAILESSGSEGSDVSFAFSLAICWLATNAELIWEITSFVRAQKLGDALTAGGEVLKHDGPQVWAFDQKKMLF
jgi:hypothetical protein